MPRDYLPAVGCPFGHLYLPSLDIPAVRWLTTEVIFYR